MFSRKRPAGLVAFLLFTLLTASWPASLVHSSGRLSSARKVFDREPPIRMNRAETGEDYHGAASSPLLSAVQAEAHSIRRLPVATKDLVYDAQTQKIYGSVPSRAGSTGNSITQINPATGDVGPSVFIGSEHRQTGDL